VASTRGCRPEGRPAAQGQDTEPGHGPVVKNARNANLVNTTKDPLQNREARQTTAWLPSFERDVRARYSHLRPLPAPVERSWRGVVLDVNPCESYPRPLASRRSCGDPGRGAPSRRVSGGASGSSGAGTLRRGCNGPMPGSSGWGWSRQRATSQFSFGRSPVGRAMRRAKPGVPYGDYGGLTRRGGLRRADPRAPRWICTVARWRGMVCHKHDSRRTDLRA
jgi:hypothetical protein